MCHVELVETRHTIQNSKNYQIELVEIDNFLILEMLQIAKKLICKFITNTSSTLKKTRVSAIGFKIFSKV